MFLITFVAKDRRTPSVTKTLRSRSKRNRRGLNMVNEMARKLNYDVQSSLRDISNALIQEAHNALAIHRSNHMSL
ncbi:hypothetical protein TNCV_2711571 [Trichonephila clavipes]|nr:hypothetical protein TNCV_2711571 [Trichonephila clavipes]